MSGGRPIPRDYYAPQPAKDPAESPQDPKPANDEILLELKRPGQQGAPGDVLRVSIREWQGRKFVDVRVHFQNENGDWIPTKKGTSVRIGELDAVADALLRASAKLGARG